MQTMESNATTGHEKSDMWDRFLDAYSEYIDDPSIGAAMSLKLWGQRLEEIDQSFSLQAFEARLCGVHLQPIAIDADR